MQAHQPSRGGTSVILDLASSEGRFHRQARPLSVAVMIVATVMAVVVMIVATVMAVVVMMAVVVAVVMMVISPKRHDRAGEATGTDAKKAGEKERSQDGQAQPTEQGVVLMGHSDRVRDRDAGEQEIDDIAS
jgi:uncharacterized membrane protein